MKTVIEVGANIGEITKRFLADKSTRVYALEPVPEMAQRLTERFAGVAEFNCIRKAADLLEGTRPFHISANKDRAASSFYHFNPVVAQDIASDIYQHVAEISVQTVRLDTLMQVEAIEAVDYLWVEAEGNDYRVLQSLGQRAKDVKAGRCTGVYQRPLHTGAENDHVRIVKWLQRNGFEVAVLPDLAMVNAELHFRRPA